MNRLTDMIIRAMERFERQHFKKPDTISISHDTDMRLRKEEALSATSPDDHGPLFGRTFLGIPVSSTPLTDGIFQFEAEVG